MAILGSLFPDLDVRLKHRVLLHNIFSMLVFLLTTATLLVYLGHTYSTTLELSLAGAYSYSTHLLLDSFTSKGVRLMWPVSSKWFGARSARYDNLLMNITFSMIGALLILLEIIR